MEIKEIMEQKKFAVVGDTLNPEKFAYKIKQAMNENNYTVYAVGKELGSINDIEEEIDIIDLCIHPVKGLELIKSCKKSFKCILIQPGAEDQALIAYLSENDIPFTRGCLLKGLAQFKQV